MKRLFFFFIPAIVFVLLCLNCTVPEPNDNKDSDDKGDDKKTSVIAVTDVELNKHSISIMVGESEQLTATVLPLNATNQNIKWNAVNPLTPIISLSDNGLVTALKEGSTSAWVTTEDGNFKDTCTIKVFTNKVAAPVLSPDQGVYESDQSISISCSTDDADIYYTNDGSDPSIFSRKYRNPINVSGPGTVVTIKAIAIKDGMADSKITTGEYRIDKVVSFPDPNLESAIRDKISKSTGDIYLSEVNSITSLTCNDSSISNILGIENLTSLTILYLNNNNISDISTLSGLISLTNLYLENNNISDISPLSELSSLNVLSLTSNNISDISPLSSLTSATSIKIVNNNISDITSLSELSSLIHLNLDINNISDIVPLSGLTSLTSLSLSSNNISDISPLSNLTSLTELNLSKNDIIHINYLSNLISLEHLNLYENNIKYLSPLSGLTSLVSLNLSSNNIDDISQLSSLTSLENLYLNYNNITELSAISDITSLEILQVSYNLVTSVKSFAFDDALGDGDLLLIRSNPLDDDSINTWIPEIESKGATVYY